MHHIFAMGHLISSYQTFVHQQLKPKATALFLLACLAIYDIFISPPEPILRHDNSNDYHTATAANMRLFGNSTNNNNHTKISIDKPNNKELDEFWDYDKILDHDVVEEDDLATSLRCYRGPALLALALFCTAYSLRVWRRNGVACDELIFLPGTPHEFRCSTTKNSTHGEEVIKTIEEGGKSNEQQTKDEEDKLDERDDTIISPLHACYSEGDADAAAGGTIKPSPLQSQHSQSDIALNSSTPSNIEQMPLMIDGSGTSRSAPNSPSLRSRFNEGGAFIRDQALKGIDMLVIRKPLRPPPLPTSDDKFPSGGEDFEREGKASASNEVYDAEYAPSAPSVLGAAMDMSLPVLFNFHMFVVLMKDHYRKEAKNEEEVGDVGGNDMNGGEGKAYMKEWMTVPQVPPKVLPLFFITPLIIRAMVPPKQRRRFYKTIMQGTILSPFKPVRFKDAFVADCLTSLVRPTGDLFYALAYYFTALGGFVSGKWGLNKAGYIVSESWILHGIVLPVLSIVPLCIKFVQSLRQAYDTNKRWPYLGNAFKYLSAGLVILYGMTHSAGSRSSWWIWAFAGATIYQCLWDTFVDWELLILAPREPFRIKRTSCARFFKICRRIRGFYQRIRLRPKRLFDDDSFYWKAFFANTALRFCWMMGFIPAYRVSIFDGSMQVTFVDKVHGWAFVLLATLEIIRRTIWAIIKCELETIKLMNNEGEDDLATASTADEYILPAMSVPGWRCRWKKNKSVKEVVWQDDSPQKKYSKIEQSDSSLDEMSSSETRKHRWLCLSVSSGFLRLMFIWELLMWLFVALGLSYLVIFAE